MHFISHLARVINPTLSLLLLLFLIKSEAERRNSICKKCGVTEVVEISLNYLLASQLRSLLQEAGENSLLRGYWKQADYY